ncbi:MAG: 2-carboxy-1,4-naphthoquinone phytyltransferase [Chloroflexaceae bacterium]|nr:2-carboxy-1,4-naphthoquinone phytyltransferase [Chloroflexaceae bacterium]
MTTKLVAQSNAKLWLAAIKPPMYSVAIMPILLGSAIAYAETGEFQGGIFWTFLSAAILILAWLNLSNDVFDSETGIDVNKAHSVVNLTGNKSLVFWIGNLCLTAGIGEILLIAWWQRDLTVLMIVAACCALGYSYQGPPFRFGYQGFGELICFVCFGPLAIAAVYYSQTQSYSAVVWGASAILGASTGIILYCSHFHQVKDDLAAGKKSPIIRLGTDQGARLLVPVTLSLFALTAGFVGLQLFSPWTLLIFLGLPLGYQLTHHVGQHHDQPDRVSNCKFIAVNLHFVTGVFLSLGFILPRLLAN